jgi:hypothetical protein
MDFRESFPKKPVQISSLYAQNEFSRWLDVNAIKGIVDARGTTWEVLKSHEELAATSWVGSVQLVTTLLAKDLITSGIVHDPDKKRLVSLLGSDFELNIRQSPVRIQSESSHELSIRMATTLLELKSLCARETFDDLKLKSLVTAVEEHLQFRLRP